MKETPTTTEPCPYLAVQSDGTRDRVPYAVYCRRGGGRVRVPSRDELERFCSSGHQLDCPGFRRTQLNEMLGAGRS